MIKSDDLNTQYNARASAADFDKDKIYREYSNAASAKLDRISDLVYDKRSGSKLDIYPAGSNAPLFVWIHGGYWRSSTKDENIFIVPGLVKKGIAVASIDYSLAPHVSLSEIVRQVRTAIAWLVANAPNYGIDTNRIHIGGHSAGGHLTGMLLVEGWTSDFSLDRNVIATALSISGLFELGVLRHTFVNDALRLDDASVAANSPIHWIPKHSAANLLLTVGGNESSEFHRQTKAFGEAWLAAGNNAQFIVMPGYHHFDIILELEKPGNPLFDALVSSILN